MIGVDEKYQKLSNTLQYAIMKLQPLEVHLKSGEMVLFDNQKPKSDSRKVTILFFEIQREGPCCSEFLFRQAFSWIGT